MLFKILLYLCLKNLILLIFLLQHKDDLQRESGQEPSRRVLQSALGVHLNHQKLSILLRAVGTRRIPVATDSSPEAVDVAIPTRWRVPPGYVRPLTRLQKRIEETDISTPLPESSDSTPELSPPKATRPRPEFFLPDRLE